MCLYRGPKFRLRTKYRLFIGLLVKTVPNDEIISLLINGRIVSKRKINGIKNRWISNLQY